MVRNDFLGKMEYKPCGQSREECRFGSGAPIEGSNHIANPVSFTIATSGRLFPGCPSLSMATLHQSVLHSSLSSQVAVHPGSLWLMAGTGGGAGGQEEREVDVSVPKWQELVALPGGSRSTFDMSWDPQSANLAIP